MASATENIRYQVEHQMATITTTNLPRGYWSIATAQKMASKLEKLPKEQWPSVLQEFLLEQEDGMAETVTWARTIILAKAVYAACKSDNGFDLIEKVINEECPSMRVMNVFDSTFKDVDAEKVCSLAQAWANYASENK